jgi:thiol-disulfide isomerase/thioredoxin
MKRYIPILILLLISTLQAQDENKIIIDKKSDKPMLVGYCNREAFQDTNFTWWFNSQYDIYDIDEETLSSIKNKIEEYNVMIVMGTWCSDSRREVPSFYKILDYLEVPEEKVTLISVDREMKSVGEEADNLSIEFVPTIIFYQEGNGEEMGRIIETPIVTLEKDLQSIIEEVN